MFRPTILAVLLCGAGLTLSGCGDDLSRSFGLTRDTPDEFTVTTRAPLSMPPDSQLRAPRPGATRPQELTSRQAAEEALAPQIALQGAGGQDSPGQNALLRQAGPGAPRDIRAKVDQDGTLDRAPTSFTDELMFWRPAAPLGTVVDAKGESQRLRQNAALGRSPDAGDTPIITPKTGGGGIFDTLF